MGMVKSGDRVVSSLCPHIHNTSSHLVAVWWWTGQPGVVAACIGHYPTCCGAHKIGNYYGVLLLLRVAEVGHAK